MSEVPPAFDGHTARWIEADHGDGILRCVCHYPLRKIDEDTWLCEGGNHQYRFDEGTIAYDKFGNVILRPKSQDEGDKDEGR